MDFYFFDEITNSLFLILFSNLILAQENKDSGAIDFYSLEGNVIPHSPDLYHFNHWTS